MRKKAKHLGMSIALGGLFLATTAVAEPTPYKGGIIAIRLTPGESPTRVSIYVGEEHRSQAGCSNGWYAFEDADQKLGLLWSAGLMSALHKKKPVYIAGNGRCDRFNIEGVDLVDLER
jgi:hypothetical protein